MAKTVTLWGPIKIGVTLEAMAGNGSNWLVILMLPFLFISYGCSPIPIIIKAAMMEPRSSMSIEVKRRIEVNDGEVPPPLVIKGMSIYIVQNENRGNAILENYVVAKFEKALQAQGALIAANPSNVHFFLELDLGPKQDAKIPKPEMPTRSKVTFTRLVLFYFYKQGQDDFPVASGKIYSTGSGDDLGWNVGSLSDALASSFGLKETKALKN